MAPKEPLQRISEDNVAKANDRIRQIKRNHRGGHLPMPTDLEFAVMKLRSAAYAYNHGDKMAAILNAREAFILAAAPFTMAELEDAPSVQEYEATRVGGQITYVPVNRLAITAGDPAFGAKLQIAPKRPGGIRGKLIGWLGG